MFIQRERRRTLLILFVPIKSPASILEALSNLPLYLALCQKTGDQVEVWFDGESERAKVKISADG